MPIPDRDFRRPGSLHFLPLGMLPLRIQLPHWEAQPLREATCWCTICQSQLGSQLTSGISCQLCVSHLQCLSPIASPAVSAPAAIKWSRRTTQLNPVNLQSSEIIYNGWYFWTVYFVAIQNWNSFPKKILKLGLQKSSFHLNYK